MKALSVSVIFLAAIYSATAFGAEDKTLLLAFSDSGETGEVVKVVKHEKERFFFSCNVRTNQELKTSNCSVLPAFDVDEIESARLAGSTKYTKRWAKAGGTTFFGGFAYLATRVFYNLKYGSSLQTFGGELSAAQAEIIRKVNVRTVAIVLVAGAIGYKLGEIAIGAELTESESQAIQSTVGDIDILDSRIEKAKRLPMAAQDYKNSLQIASNILRYAK